MVSITNEYGTFEGETIRQANAKAKRAEKAAKEAAAVRAEHWNIAHDRAAARGFQWLTRVMEGGDAKIYAELIAPTDFYADYYFTFGTDEDTGGHLYTVYLKDVKDRADAEPLMLSMWRKRFLGAIANLGGHTIGYAFQDRDTDEVTVKALGACEGEWVATTVPGLKVSQFSRIRNRSGRESVTAEPTVSN